MSTPTTSTTSSSSLPLPQVPPGVWGNDLYCSKWEKEGGCDRTSCPLIHLKAEDRMAQVEQLAKQGVPVKFCLRHLKSIHQGRPGKICRGAGMANCGFYHGKPEEEAQMLRRLNKIADPNLLPRSAICRYSLLPGGCPLPSAAYNTTQLEVCHLVHPEYLQNYLELIAGKTSDEEIAEVFPSAPKATLIAQLQDSAGATTVGQQKRVTETPISPVATSKSGRRDEDPAASHQSFISSPSASGGGLTTRSMLSDSTNLMTSPSASMGKISSTGAVSPAVVQLTMAKNSRTRTSEEDSQVVAAPTIVAGANDVRSPDDDKEESSGVVVVGRNLGEYLQPGQWVNDLFCDTMRGAVATPKCADPSLCPLIHCSREQRGADMKVMVELGFPVHFCLRYLNALARAAAKGGRAKVCRNCAFHHGTEEEFQQLREKMSHCSDPKKLPKAAFCRAFLTGEGCSDPTCKFVHPKVLARFKQSIRGKTPEEIEEMYPSAPPSSKRDETPAPETNEKKEEELPSEKEAAIKERIASLIASINNKEQRGRSATKERDELVKQVMLEREEWAKRTNGDGPPPSFSTHLLSATAKPFVPSSSTAAPLPELPPPSFDEVINTTTTAGPTISSSRQQQQEWEEVPHQQHPMTTTMGTATVLQQRQHPHLLAPESGRLPEDSVDFVSSPPPPAKTTHTTASTTTGSRGVSPPLQHHVDPSPTPHTATLTTTATTASESSITAPVVASMVLKVPVPRERAVVLKFHSETPRPVIRGVLNFGGLLTHVKTRTKADIQQIYVCAYYSSAETAKVFPHLANHFFGEALAAPGAVPLKEHLKSNPTDQFYFEVKEEQQAHHHQYEEEECDFGTTIDPEMLKAPLPAEVVALMQHLAAVTPEIVQEFLLNLEEDEE